MNRIALFFSCWVMCISCIENKDNTVVYNEPYYPIVKQSVITPLNQNLIMRPTNMMQLFGKYIVLPARSIDNDNVFQLLSTDDGKHICGFARLGRAKNELSDYLRYCIDHSSEILYSIDNSNKIVGFDLNAIINGNANHTIMAKQFDKSHPTSLQIQISNDNIIQTSGTLNSRIFITNIEGDTLLKYDNIPHISNNAIFDNNFNNRFMAQYAHYTVKPDLQKIANATNNGMLLEILSVSNKNIEKHNIRYFYEPQMESLRKAKDECIFGTTQIQSTDKYIYILYYDSPMKTVENSTPIVGVFDWDGNEVACYNLNNQVISFVVTPDDTRIYCWAYNSEGEGYLGFLDLNQL